MSARSERYREIVEVLSVHGFGFVVGAAGMAGRFPFRRGLPGHQQGRLYAQPEHLRLALEQLGPTFVKLGQILSTRPDVLPPEYTAELVGLQDRVPPVPADAALTAISEELGPQPALLAVQPEPLAGASIGQVHAARLGDADVVVKVRRPGVVEQVETDLEILQDLAERATRRWPAARDHDVIGLVQEFADTFRNELDYLREARNAERFTADFAGDPDVHVPAVFWDATTSRILTLERVFGIKIDDLGALDAAGLNRRELAVRATRVLCTMVFENGFFHADPHPGNFFVQADGSLGIIDFGMVGELDDALRDGLVVLLVNLVRGDAARTTDALLDLAAGSEDVDRAALRVALAPLVGTFGGLSLAELGTTELLTDLLALVRRHHLHLPRDLLLLFKVLVMAEGLGQRLDPDFRIATVVAPFAERLAARRFEPGAVARRIAEGIRDLARAGLGSPPGFRGLTEALEAAAADVHVSAGELRRLVEQTQRTGDRIVVAVLAAALVNGVAHVVAGVPSRPVWQRAAAVGGTGLFGVLAVHAIGRARGGAA